MTKTLFYKKTDEGGKTYIHRFLLENLKPGEKYYYKFKSKKVYSFRMPDTSNCFRFGNMGDNRSGPKHWNKIASGLLTSEPDFCIFNGDLAYDESYENWINDFFTPDGQKLISKIPFYNAVGNHEGWENNTRAFLQSPYQSDEKQAFYNFDRGNTTFLILSTEHNVQPGSKQWEFAEKVLSNSDKKWKIVVFHIPAYSSGAHGENKNMKRFTSKVFEKYGVDIILTGHSHYYQHNLVNDIHHFVIGGGGSPLYPPKKSKYTIAQKKAYHFAIFDVCNENIQIKIIAEDGNLIDSIKIEK